MIGLDCRMITAKTDFSENFWKMAATVAIFKKIAYIKNQKL